MRIFLLGLLVLGSLVEPATGQARADSTGAPRADTTARSARPLMLRHRPAGGGVRIRSVHNSRPRLILMRPAGPVPPDTTAGPSPTCAPSPRDLQAIETRLARRLDERFAQWLALQRLNPPPAAAGTTPPPGASVPSADTLSPTPSADRPTAPLTDDALSPGAITPAAVETALLETGLFRALNVYFEVNRSTLLPPSRETLDALGEVLTRHPALRLEIGGHTDNTGPADYNLRLSQARAEAVRRYLIERFGIAPERLVARGYGETRPIADNATPTGRTLNRRVEFRVIE